jgi:hypothetical protein
MAPASMQEGSWPHARAAAAHVHSGVHNRTTSLRMDRQQLSCLPHTTLPSNTSHARCHTVHPRSKILMRVMMESMDAHQRSPTVSHTKLAPSSTARECRGRNKTTCGTRHMSSPASTTAQRDLPAARSAPASCSKRFTVHAACTPLCWRAHRREAPHVE